MSKQFEGFDVTLKAAADLSAKQYYFVKQTSTNEEVNVATAITDVPVGILQNKPSASGKEAAVRVLGHSKVVAGETATAGNVLGVNARSSAAVLTVGTETTNYIAGVCTLGGSSSEVIEMVLSMGPARAQ